MTDSPHHSALERLSGGLLGAFLAPTRPGHTLLIHHHLSPVPQPPDEPGFLRLIVEAGEDAPAPMLQCRSSALPIADHSLHRVILFHVLASGDEPELAEACRVLSPGGELFAVGLNRIGYRFWRRNPARLPGLSPLRVKRALDGFGMVMRGFAGAGLAGRLRPAWMSTGWPSLGAPIADVVILKAAHRETPGVNRLIFRKPAASIVQSAHEY